MMKTIIFILAVLITAFTSCTRNERLAPTPTQSMPSQVHDSTQAMEGEDEDRRILMKVNDQFQIPVTSADVFMIKDNDTLAQKTDASGEALFFAKDGVWETLVMYQSSLVKDTIIHVNGIDDVIPLQVQL